MTALPLKVPITCIKSQKKITESMGCSFSLPSVRPSSSPCSFAVSSRRKKVWKNRTLTCPCLIIEFEMFGGHLLRTLLLRQIITKMEPAKSLARIPASMAVHWETTDIWFHRGNRWCDRVHGPQGGMGLCGSH